MIAESPLAHFLLSSRDFQWREGEDRPRLGQDIQLFHVFAFSGAVEFWGCSSRMLRGLLPRRAVGARDWESPGPNFELAVGEA
ncbi:MAG: hypothetical protein FJZ01_26820, partial [Candidatus Sericytochromatia bacterium]|nr:hypothetical protein [Candidatus Tanganyikabacteria bacterium]